MIRYKRVYDPAEQEDGWRVLADRLWPRGVVKLCSGQMNGVKPWPRQRNSVSISISKPLVTPVLPPSTGLSWQPPNCRLNYNNWRRGHPLEQ